MKTGAVMSKSTKRQEILDIALELLKEHPEGLRYTALKNLIMSFWIASGRVRKYPFHHFLVTNGKTLCKPVEQ